MKLLIVDDQRSVHLYLQKALDLPAVGFDAVLHAENGAQALDIICRERPQVMLLDVQMPGMDGIALLERLKQQQIERPETIVLSAYDEFVYAKRCIDFGVRRYVLKPIDPQELTGILAETIQNIQSRRLDGYRLAFPLLCAHYRDGFDLNDLPIGQLEALNYGVACVRSRDDRHPALKDFEAVSRSTQAGFTWLLLAVPGEKTWAEWSGERSGPLREAALAVGLSGAHGLPQEMAQAAREAADALWQSFYQADVRRPEPGFFTGCGAAARDGLRAIGKCFLSEDYASLCEIAGRTFKQFAREKCAPSDVLDACRTLLARLYMDHGAGPAPDFGAWPGQEGMLTAAETCDALVRDMLALRQKIDPSMGRSDAEAIEHLRAYVDEHYGEDLSLSAMAERFCVSRFQISRLFKQSFGVNYQDYVLSVRMKAAARLLTHSNMRLYEISVAVGFDEPSYFSNVFKKTYGLSPRAYRIRERERKNDR